MNEDDTFEALKRQPTEDEIKFGRNAWIYCAMHMRPHKTGWCTVNSLHKQALKALTDIEAHHECRKANLPIY